MKQELEAKTDKKTGKAEAKKARYCKKKVKKMNGEIQKIEKELRHKWKMEINRTERRERVGMRRGQMKRKGGINYGQGKTGDNIKD